MRGALVQEENARLAIERARKKHALLLPTRERTSHVTHKAVVGHRHGHDLLVDARKLRTGDHPLLVELGIKEADVVRNRAGEELILLHDRPDLLPISTRANHR